MNIDMHEIIFGNIKFPPDLYKVLLQMVDVDPESILSCVIFLSVADGALLSLGSDRTVSWKEKVPEFSWCLQMEAYR